MEIKEFYELLVMEVPEGEFELTYRGETGMCTVEMEEYPCGAECCGYCTTITFKGKIIRF